MMPYYPLVAKTLKIRDPKSVLILVPTFPAVVAALVVGVVFVVWPNLMNHAPIGFEPGGMVHHVWHYSLLAGSVLALVGMFGAGPHRIRNELIGTIVVTATVAVNFAATIGAMVDHQTEQHPGLLVAFDAAVLVSFALRLYVLIFQPTIPVVNHTRVVGSAEERLSTGEVAIDSRDS